MRRLIGVAADSLALPGVSAARRSTGFAALERLRRGLAASIRAEAAHLDMALVVPVALGTGILLYFAAPEEPGLAGPVAASLVLAAAAIAAGRRQPIRRLALVLCLVAAGFADGRIRTLLVAAPVLAGPTTGPLRAVVLGTDERPDGSVRLLLRPLALADLAEAALPHRLRITARKDTVTAGDTIRLTVSLRPPSPPVAPGAYDFGRDAYFDGVGGVGFALGPVTADETPAALAPAERLAAGLDRFRNALTARIVSVIGGENGAVAASQVTGKRGLIPEDANAALRASGLYHVVSISGLHMALFAGGLFWLIRALLALSSRAALGWPLKGLAAALSLLPAAAYTAFSGAEIATVRAFIMTAIVLVAVALGRSAVTRRNVAIAATAVLAVTPEEIVGPSFGMSFAAVAMLVAWHERPRRTAIRPGGLLLERLAGKIGRTVLLLITTTVVASLATAPFAAYHFHRLTLQSLAANCLATPIVSCLIMPLAVAALVAEPFGYGGPLWSATGVAVGWFMAVARLVARWPGADLSVAAMPVAALLAFALALVLLALLRTRLALVAALPIGAGLVLAMSTPQPSVLIGAGGHAALLRRSSGETSVLASPRDAFTVRQWLQAMGDQREPSDVTLKAAARCDPEGCILPSDEGRTVALDRTLNAVEEDCGRVSVLVTPLDLPAPCARHYGPEAGGAALALGKAELARAGAFALTFETDADGRPVWQILPALQDQRRPWQPVLPPPNLAAPAKAAPVQPADSSGEEAQ